MTITAYDHGEFGVEVPPPEYFTVGHAMVDAAGNAIPMQLGTGYVLAVRVDVGVAKTFVVGQDPANLTQQLRDGSATVSIGAGETAYLSSGQALYIAVENPVITDEVQLVILKFATGTVGIPIINRLTDDAGNVLTDGEGNELITLPTA